MGAGQSTEKKSPTKDVSPNKEEKVSPRKSSSSSNSEDVVKTETPTKSTSAGDCQPTVKIDLHVSEEEVASVEAVSKKMKDTVGGTSIEIVLSPAIKKVQYYEFSSETLIKESRVNKYLNIFSFFGGRSVIALGVCLIFTIN